MRKNYVNIFFNTKLAYIYAMLWNEISTIHQKFKIYYQIYLNAKLNFYFVAYYVYAYTMECSKC